MTSRQPAPLPAPAPSTFARAVATFAREPGLSPRWPRFRCALTWPRARSQAAVRQVFRDDFVCSFLAENRAVTCVDSAHRELRKTAQAGCEIGRARARQFVKERLAVNDDVTGDERAGARVPQADAA